MRSINPVIKTIAIGIVAGMRAALAPAIAAQILNTHKSKRISNSPLKFIQSDGFAITSKILAVGELVADKLPSAPDRIEPGGIAARCISGGLSAAAISTSRKKEIVAFAVLGAASAVASAYAFYYFRKRLAQNSRIPDAILGGLEDSIAIAIGITIIKSTDN